MGRATGRDERAPLAGALLTAHQLPNRDRSRPFSFHPSTSRPASHALRRASLLITRTASLCRRLVAPGARPPVRPSPRVRARARAMPAHAAGSTVTVSQHHYVLLRLKSVASTLLPLPPFVNQTCSAKRIYFTPDLFSSTWSTTKCIFVFRTFHHAQGAVVGPFTRPRDR